MMLWDSMAANSALVAASRPVSSWRYQEATGREAVVSIRCSTVCLTGRSCLLAPMTALCCCTFLLHVTSVKVAR